jgi:hypothetical protein
MKTAILGRIWYLTVLIGLLATMVALQARGAVLGFEPGDADRHFVFAEMGPYEPNPYDAPDDGADRLARQTASVWVGLKSGESDAASLYWDGGLDGGANTPLNRLLPDTFDLGGFLIAGVYGAQTVTLQGLNDGRVLYMESIAIDLTPQLFQAGWMDIDQLLIVSGTDFVAHPDHASAGDRRNWAIDDLIYDEDVLPVPLPSSALMLALGSVLVTVSGWRVSAAAGGESHR